jgi:RNA polymerase sigma-70 factor (family 1)
VNSNNQILDYWREVVFNSDSKAFEQLFYSINAKCIKFCRQYIHDKETAEEIVSDVFVDVWLNRNKLGHVLKPEVYMLISIKNKALNHWKKSSHMQLVSIDDEVTELPNTYRPDEELERKELMMQLDKAVNSLPNQCRIIFKLVKEDGMKCGEVAEVLNVSVRTVHTQIYRAMNKLNVLMLKYQEPTPAAIVRDIASAVAITFFYFFLSACK